MIGVSEINHFGAGERGITRFSTSAFRGNKAGSARRLPTRPAIPVRVRGELPTVREFTVPPAIRMAHAVASAAIVRDAAALGAVILFATMIATVLVGMDPSV
jgi:hypothetical protein